ANGGLGIHAQVKVRVADDRFPDDIFPSRSEWDEDAGEWHAVAGTDSSPVVRRYGDGTVLVETTLGRLLFNESLPRDYAYYPRTESADPNHGLTKKDLGFVVGELVERYPKAIVGQSLDSVKDLGFEYATRAGLTISVADV